MNKRNKTLLFLSLFFIVILFAEKKGISKPINSKCLSCHSIESICKEKYTIDEENFYTFVHGNLKKQESGFNLLLITIDTLRADRLSCYSTDHVKTPNIDFLASRGIHFTRAFAHTSTTLPSHTNILLGTTPLYHGVHDNANFIVRDEFLTLAEHLKCFGYSTGAFVGAFPLDTRFGLSQGFDIYDDNYLQHNRKETVKERKAEVVVDRALEWLNRQKSKWFLWIHCYDPHDPYTPPEPFMTQYEKRPYDGEVAYVDSILGKLFRLMNETNLFARTVIVFTGDHGESLGEHGEETHGFLAYNSSIWVPLIISAPGIKHRKVNQNVSHIDIFPTICDLLKVEKPPFLQGASLLPSLRGKKLARRSIYFESLSPYYSFGWAPIKGYVDDEEKFIDSPIPEFYNLKEDFVELKNLIGQKNLDGFKKKLNRIISSQTHTEHAKAEQRMDRETLQRLKSLGYLTSSQRGKKEKFGPEDDVKVLLPYYYKASQALELCNEGKINEGMELLKEIITENKYIPHAYMNLAVAYKDLGRSEDALEVFKLAFEYLPENYDIFSGVITFLTEDKKYDTVIEAVKANYFWEMDYDPVIWNYVGLAFWYKGNPEEAQRYWKRSIEIDRKYPLPYNNLGTLYFSVFRKTRDSKAFEMAIENLRKAIKLDPFNSKSYNTLGLIYLEAGYTEKAILNLEEALNLQPDFDDVLYNLGVAHMRNKEYIIALTYFSRFKYSPSFHYLSSSEKAKLEEFIRNCTPKPEKK